MGWMERVRGRSGRREPSPLHVEPDPVVGVRSVDPPLRADVQERAAPVPARPTWAVAAATALGGTHRRSGLPNQDAHLVVALDGATVLVVADGHGSPASFRSDRGARLATDAGARLARDLFVRSASLSDPASDLVHHLGPLIGDMVARWQEAVRLDAAGDPIAADTVGWPAEPDDSDLLRAYGSTFLLAVLADRFAAFVQVGDGDLVVGSPTGPCVAAVAGDDRLIGNVTTSLCHVDVERDARWSVRDLVAEPISIVLLATDGYGNAFEDDPWQPGVIEDLEALAAEHGVAWVSDSLPAWAEDAAMIAGDDVTILVGFAGIAAGDAGGRENHG